MSHPYQTIDRSNAPAGTCLPAPGRTDHQRTRERTRLPELPAPGPAQRRQILRDATVTFTRRGAGLDDGLDVHRRREIRHDAIVAFTLPGSGFDDRIDIELLPEIPREPSPALTLRGADWDDGFGVAERREILRAAMATWTGPGAGYDDGLDDEQRGWLLRDKTPEFTCAGAESDDCDGKSWFDPESWLITQYQCREVVPVSVREYVAMIWIAIRPAKRIADKYMNWLIEDSGTYEFAWSALYLIVEWHRRRAMELPRSLEAWYRPIPGRVAATGRSGRPSKGQWRNFLRNLAIHDLVCTAHHYLKLPVSRNREPSANKRGPRGAPKPRGARSNPSARDMVAALLPNLPSRKSSRMPRRKLKPSSVLSIYQRHITETGNNASPVRRYHQAAVDARREGVLGVSTWELRTNGERPIPR